MVINTRGMARSVRLTLKVALGALAMSATPAWAAGQAATEDPVTFSKHIAPILQRSCQSCHRPPPGGGAPMSLLTYEDVRPWARAIKQRTSLREMPPWFIEKNVGIQKFKDDPSLSDAEIALIGKWVDSGAPRGNPADLPSPRTFPNGTEWTIGKPDLIVSSPEVKVEAVAADWHGYWKPTLTGMTEERYIQAVEVHEVRVRQGAPGGGGAGGGCGGPGGPPSGGYSRQGAPGAPDRARPHPGVLQD